MKNKTTSGKRKLLKREQRAFDRQIKDRVQHGFVPDLRRLRKVNWFYNNVWRDPEYVKIHWIPKVNFVIENTKKNGGKVVELGCGSGYLSLELARNGLDVLGIDVSPKCIEIARAFYSQNSIKKGFGNLSYECCNIDTFDFGEKQFDTVIFFRTLHHLQDLDSLFRNISRGLKKNGSLIICEPIRENFTKESAFMAAIFRTLLPTWIPYRKKLKEFCSEKAWDKYVASIYREYSYENEFRQSPMDNVSCCRGDILRVVKKYFKVRLVSYSDAFIDKLIGGLRGKDRYVLARFLEFLDQLMVKRNILNATEITILAKKK